MSKPKSKRKVMIKPRKLAPKKLPKRGPNGLSPRQAAFVTEYLKDRNGLQAALRAGYAKGSASVQGSRLIANAKVRSAIEKRVEVITEKATIDATWLLDRLAHEAQADMRDLYDNEGKFKPIDQWPLIWRQGLVSGIEMVADTKDGVTTMRVGGVKLADRAKRLEMLGKHVGVQAFRERVDHGLTQNAAETLIKAGMSVHDAAQKYREKLG